jgi:molybdopterin molybdotransferase
MTAELDVHAAIAALCGQLVPVRQNEPCALADAQGRILSVDLQAQLDLPAFANSAVDGYAVRTADCIAPVRLRVVGEALAGHGYHGKMAAGTAVRIMTGAPLPDNADAVVMQEEASAEGECVSFARPVRAGQYVRARGEHVRAGDVLLAKGSRLHAAEIGLATAVGITHVQVYRRLRVGVASTGDELADPPARLDPAASYDGNRPWLALACRSAGFDVVDLGICRDDATEFAQLVERGCTAELDALLICGGSALGDADIVRKAETVRFLAVNIGPGRGITFADFGVGDAPLVMFGLPGNAVSAFVMFQLIVLPALCHLAGGRARVPSHFPLPLAAEVACRPGRVDYRRGRLEYNAAGELTVRPLDRQGAGMLRTIVEADVLIAAGPHAHYRAGDRIDVVLLAALAH